MGSGASARLEEATKASFGDLKAGIAWKEAALDNVVVLGDYALLGACVLGQQAMDMSIPFSERGDGKKLVCIVDCGRPDVWFSKFYGRHGCLEGKNIETWVMLMPSVDSDPLYYGDSFTLTVPVACSVVAPRPDADLRFVHRDFFFAQPIGAGFDWLPDFLDSKAAILPASKRDSMKRWVQCWFDNAWGARAGMMWACAAGMEEDDMSDLGRLKELLETGKAPEESEFRFPGTVLAVVVAKEGDSVKVTCTNMTGDEVCSKDFAAGDTIAELVSHLGQESPERAPPTIWHESTKLSEDSKLADYTALTATRPLDAPGQLPDLLRQPVARLRFAFGGCHGLAEEFGLEQFDAQKVHRGEHEETVLSWEEAGAELIFFVDVESLNTDFLEAVEKIIETCFSVPTIVFVFIAKDFDGFKCPNLVYHLNMAVECVALCVLATLDDLEKVKSVFLKTAPIYPSYQCMAQAMKQYPRLAFCTLLGEDGKTCGKSVPDASLLFTSLKFGSGAPELPRAKLTHNQFIIGPDGPLHFLTVPGDGAATLISPCPLLVEIFKMAACAGCTEGRKPDIRAAMECFSSLASEYSDFGGGAREAQEGWPALEAAPPPPADDGSLESARERASGILLNDIKEVRRFRHPPPSLLLPMKAAATFLSLDFDTADETSEWKSYQRMLGMGDFIQRLVDLEPDVVTEQQWQAVREIAADPRFTVEVQSRCSLIGATITSWVLAMLKRCPAS